jgi:peptidoglycan/LPS O-acetylase OafA/YrhL
VLTGVLWYLHGLLPTADTRPDFSMPAIRLALSALFVNQFWNLTVAALTNGPYRSLCYEVWYYVLFGVVFFSRGFLRCAGGAILLLVMGPRIVLLLPLWLLGVGLYFVIKGGFSVRHRLAPAAFVTSVALLAWVVDRGTPVDRLTRWIEASLRDGYLVVGGQRIFIGGDANFLSDWVLGLVFGLTVLLSSGLRGAALSTSWWAAAVRTASSYTFSTYLYHAPVLFFVHPLLVLVLPGALVPAVCLAVIAAVVVGLGRVTEHRKEPYVVGFRRLLGVPVRAAA